MIRLHFVVEGQTEETFVHQVFVDHFGHYNISTDVRVVETSRGHKGGVLNYLKAKGDLLRWLKEDQKADARFTTMFDLYALPESFPSHGSAKKLLPLPRIEALEAAFGADVEDTRFIPYLQLHEFEALLLTDPAKLESHFCEYAKEIAALSVECAGYDSPELINDGPLTAPSKRIIQKVPGYRGAKASAGPLVAMNIGLPAMRAKCPHFNAWVSKLEQLANPV